MKSNRVRHFKKQNWCLALETGAADSTISRTLKGAFLAHSFADSFSLFLSLCSFRRCLTRMRSAASSRSEKPKGRRLPAPVAASRTHLGAARQSSLLPYPNLPAGLHAREKKKREEREREKKKEKETSFAVSGVAQLKPVN